MADNTLEAWGRRGEVGTVLEWLMVVLFVLAFFAFILSVGIRVLFRGSIAADAWRNVPVPSFLVLLCLVGLNLLFRDAFHLY